ncbi:acid-sensing ion channel 1C-like [Physella acuta]|uniref:acid-sensing ion channel 1C-like n=1 Tax=Physella acuta TaxID=109671 RepID=UPI0027DDF089|nr:acid-sensing ion channel 1C-like [Physella acuta]
MNNKRNPYYIGYEHNDHGYSDPYLDSGATSKQNYGHDVEQTNQRSGPRTESPAKRPRKKRKETAEGLAYIVEKFADITSLNGMPYIVRSRTCFVKIVWTILFLAAVGAMIYHLYSLLTKFFDYNKTSKVSLNFSTLPFPAVTICNVNVLRKSKLENSSIDNIQDLVAKMNPEAIKQKVDDCTVEGEWKYDDDVDVFLEEPDEDIGVCLDRILKSIIMSMYDYDEDNAIDNDYPDTWESTGQESVFDALDKIFKEYYLNLSADTRKEIGHQVNDMVLQCSFAGKRCFPDNFTHVFSENYGNCYTLQYDKFIVRKSGPSGGLELTLFIETDEYLPGITHNKGVRVVIHEQGTVPFPDEEGLSVMPGTNTYIGIKQINVERLSSPWGKCTVDDYSQKYNRSYTRNTCQGICEQNYIRKVCQCLDESKQEINKIMGNAENLTSCENATQLKCLTKVTFNPETIQCDCSNPCKETVFEKDLSSTEWPSVDLAQIFAVSICKSNPNMSLSLLNKQVPKQLTQDFVKLNIFYQDLNYELLTENPDYELSQLMSDIGGTIGLWIGLSVLGIFEVVHLITRLLVFLYDYEKKKDIGHQQRPCIVGYDNSVTGNQQRPCIVGYDNSVTGNQQRPCIVGYDNSVTGNQQRPCIVGYDNSVTDYPFISHAGKKTYLSILCFRKLRGLDPTLFMETDEDIPVITRTKDFRIVIHEQGIIQFPDEEGLNDMLGTSTLIGLK